MRKRTTDLMLGLMIGTCLSGAAASSSTTSSAPEIRDQPPQSLRVVDSRGLDLTRVYSNCSAVGEIIVSGNYDKIERDGQIEVFLGFDGGKDLKRNQIYVSVDAAPWCTP